MIVPKIIGKQDELIEGSHKIWFKVKIRGCSKN
jgi:hypothetical protein